MLEPDADLAELLGILPDLRILPFRQPHRSYTPGVGGQLFGDKRQRDRALVFALSFPSAVSYRHVGRVKLGHAILIERGRHRCIEGGVVFGWHLDSDENSKVRSQRGDGLFRDIRVIAGDQRPPRYRKLIGQRLG